MASPNNDLEKVSNLIKAGNNSLDAKMDKGFSKVNHKLEEHDTRFDRLDSKINKLSKMENEDIVAAYRDISNIKTRLKKAGI